MGLLDRIWGGKKVESASSADTVDYWLNQGFVLGKSGRHDEATRCFEKAKALKLDKKPITFTIPIKDYTLYYSIISDLMGTVDVKLIGNKHSAYCTKYGYQFRKEALEMLCMAQVFKNHGSGISVRGSNTEGNELRAGRCPRCGRSEMAISVEVQGIVPPREEETAKALVKIGEPSVEPLIQVLKENLIQALKDEVKDENSSVRFKAVQALGEISDSRATEPLIRALKDEAPDVRAKAAWALGMIRNANAVEPLIQTLIEEYPTVRTEAAWSLGELGDARAIEPLIQALKDKDSSIRGIASEALVNIGKPSVEPLIQTLKDKDPRVRKHAAKSLGEMEDVRAVEPLIRALKDEDSDVRVYAMTALRDIGKPSIELLIQASNDEDKNVRGNIAYILKEIEDAKRWYNKGYSHIQFAREFNKAIRDFDKAVELDPKYARAWYYKGYALIELGNYDEAIKAYDKVTELTPQDAAAWSNKGLALYHKGNYNEAIKAYDEAIKLSANLLTLQTAWYGKGVVLDSLDRNTEAEAAFAKVRELGSQQKKPILLPYQLEFYP